MILNLIFLSMIFISFKVKSWWITQNFFFFFFFFMYFKIPMYNYFSNISYVFGMDMFSYLMFMLGLWIISLTYLASINIKFHYSKYFNVLMFIFIIIFFFCFFSNNFILFYIFYEINLIPIIILIYGWGYQYERFKAGFYLFIYMIFFSLPFFSCLLYLNKIGFIYMYYFDYVNKLNSYFFFLLMMIFLVKMPLFMFHIWLPKAHVEAPISGSMILAGIMLKLGGFGIYHILMLIFKINLNLSFFFISLSLFGMFILSLVCFFQSDLKILIAYSSVVHMGLVIIGFLTLSYWGFCGSLLLMVGHGLCSSGLFCLSNICYLRFKSRSMFLNKGLINLYPYLSFWWFLLCSSNMSFPPSLNLFGELMLLINLMMWLDFLYFYYFILMILMFLYSLYLYLYTQYGKLFFNMNYLVYINLSEYMLLFLHWFPLNLMFLLMELFL
uniref:NADH-ubiquinone oxidoreductase chain 4 n=1 Tax=Nurudea yanoniella TaxID=509176 RepID=A0A1Z1MWD8_9HEMI|nr:NADH dehydrogenase subunit 4 [Nurudea yanoniella]ARW70272.1 NADH dehydrogenase subunit 4 [Nurudea yanoniella]QBK84289.1 NADH dehydrogenase subunit 4 [Nurudea yanoniella]